MSSVIVVIAVFPDKVKISVSNISDFSAAVNASGNMAVIHGFLGVPNSGNAVFDIRDGGGSPDLLVNAVAISYAVFSYITFSRCYAASICPRKEAGLFVMIGSAAVMLLMALLPDGQISKEDKKTS